MKLPINQFLHQLRLKHKQNHAVKIVFLSIGNPVRQYNGTRHNAGHMVLESVQTRLGGLDREISTSSAVLGPLSVNNNVYFAQSTEYMNLSGKALQAVTRAVYGDDVQIVVVHDDMEIEPGQVKFKLASKSFGGHNGLKDLAKYGEFPRIRIGVGPPQAMDSRSVSKHVLSKFTLTERQSIEGQAVDETANMISSVLEILQQRPKGAL